MQLALINAVAVLPDRSSLKLTINGHVFAALPVHSPDKSNVARVKIPAGVLVPGSNTVEIGVALAHRVDCSVNATYELWAMLDPAQTGIVTDRGSPSSARTLTAWTSASASRRRACSSNTVPASVSATRRYRRRGDPRHDGRMRRAAA